TWHWAVVRSPPPLLQSRLPYSFNPESEIFNPAGGSCAALRDSASLLRLLTQHRSVRLRSFPPRAGGGPWLFSQNHRPILGHRDAVLEMGAVAAVFGYSSPLVVQQPSAWLADVHHRLDRQHHAVAQLRTMPRSSVVRNLWFFMQPGADAVPDKLAHHAETIAFHVLLHRRPDIADGISRARRLNAPEQRLASHFEKLL